MPDRIPIFRPPWARRRVTDRSAPETRERKAVYNSALWLALRQAYLAQHPLCEHCHRHGDLRLAVHVHHRIDLAHRPDLAYSVENLEALCLPCHSRETARRMHRCE